jgi:propanol-preferring alcohol dehydrogenase
MSRQLFFVPLVRSLSKGTEIEKEEAFTPAPAHPGFDALNSMAAGHGWIDSLSWLQSSLDNTARYGFSSSWRRKVRGRIEMMGKTMMAMVLRETGKPLVKSQLPIPQPGAGQVLVKVGACAVCRTDLHVVDGELRNPKIPLIPGHEIVGKVEKEGPQVSRLKEGDRVGIPWLGSTCGRCYFCSNAQENLCEKGLFTGYTVDGGYAEYTLADERFCVPIPDSFSENEAAPLLCAGLIGYRSLTKTGQEGSLGIYGFGAAAHIVSQVAVHQGRQVYAFTRPGDTRAQEFALTQGAAWAGDSTSAPPVELDAAIIFAPVGALVPLALRAVRKGGIVVCGGIYMSEIPAFDYALLWGERQLVSVANLTRQDGIEFMRIAPEIPIKTTIEPFELSQANEALSLLRTGEIEGAAVLRCD